MFTITLIFLAFVFLHSLTVTRWFKERARRRFGGTFMRVWYRFLYNALAAAAVAVAFPMMRRVPDRHLWTAPSLLQWLLSAVRGAAIVFGALSFRHLDALEFLGLRQVWRFLARGETGGDDEGLTQQGLVTSGVYGMVRHPLYVAAMVVVTANPHVTVNGLTFTVLADLYFLFGMLIEERRFLRTFGEPYREYLRTVPRMVPRLRRRPGGRDPQGRNDR